jgi:hypothetical protein
LQNLCHELRSKLFIMRWTRCNLYGFTKGRAIAQAVSRWLPTVATRVRARVWSSGICGGQICAGASFLLVLRFPLPILIPLNSPSSQSLGAGTISQKWPKCRVDPVWTPPPTMRIKKYIKKIILETGSVNGTCSEGQLLRTPHEIVRNTTYNLIRSLTSPSIR